MQVTVSTKGQVVLPAEIRRRYGIEPGTRLQVVDTGRHICLVPAHEDPIRAARGMLKGETSMTQALLRERAEERQREDAR